jgi:hypothetical protein
LAETGDHTEHISSMFHFHAKKVFSDARSYAQIQAVDQYLKEGQPLHKKREASSILKCGVFLWTLMYMCMLFVDSHVWMILFMW